MRKPKKKTKGDGASASAALPAAGEIFSAFAQPQIAIQRTAEMHHFATAKKRFEVGERVLAETPMLFFMTSEAPPMHVLCQILQAQLSPSTLEFLMPVFQIEWSLISRELVENVLNFS